MSSDEEFDRQLELEAVEKQQADDAYTHTDPNDGSVYEWDAQRKAWFPKVDDDFLAAYQASYGIDTSTGKDDAALSEGTSSATQEEQETKQKGPKRKGDEGWFEIEGEKNTNVYVSGLPDDTTLDEFKELMNKCGIITEEEDTGKPRLKLYTDSEGNLKGDGLCTYLKRESVDLAMQLLDDYDFRGSRIHVEQAQFAIKGQYNPSLKKKKKKTKKKKNPQERLLTWRPDKKFHQRKRNEQVVIIKHMFDPSEFAEDAMLINDIRDDLKAECSKFGEVNKVLIFDNHPEGVTSVRFKDADDADKCVAAMNGRWFAKRQLTAELWDGKTDYKIEETDREREARLAQWEKFLTDEDKKDGKGGGEAGAGTETGTNEDKKPEEAGVNEDKKREEAGVNEDVKPEEAGVNEDKKPEEAGVNREQMEDETIKTMER
ncbi:17S U2 SnRNP complex component HTATSF1-like [Apostichopus japonicus]|uniref:17S U2 SnRNP complex component HTATSF1-like n=1 Tax=Stichopus japonicus TaxID=307972 RepID=UPI003AB4347B